MAYFYKTSEMDFYNKITLKIKLHALFRKNNLQKKYLNPRFIFY